MKNIEINYKGGTSYEVLYPKTTTKNLIDFGEVLYTKEEVNNFITGLSNQVGNLHFAYGTYTGQFERDTVTLDKNTTATDWITVTVGFQPIGVILSESGIHHGAYVVPWAPYTQSTGWQTTQPIGFTIPWRNGIYPVLQATANGFQIRNLTAAGGMSFNPNLTYLSYIYAYLAFG